MNQTVATDRQRRGSLGRRHLKQTKIKAGGERWFRNGCCIEEVRGNVSHSLQFYLLDNTCSLILERQQTQLDLVSSHWGAQAALGNLSVTLRNSHDRHHKDTGPHGGVDKAATERQRELLLTRKAQH